MNQREVEAVKAVALLSAVGSLLSSHASGLKGELEAMLEMANQLEYYPDVRTAIRLALVPVRGMLETAYPYAVDRLDAVVEESNVTSEE